jgi:polyisoprenoid-binding protein YceI
MAGTTREVEISGTAAQEDDLVRVKAQKQINMKDWGIKPPSLMMGAMKVKESVTVGFDVTLKP